MTDILDAEYLGISRINKSYAISYNWLSFAKSRKVWVALITGVCPKYGFKREFVPREESGVKGQPDLTAYRWKLATGGLFQYKNFMVDYLSDKVVDGYFITLNNGIIPLEEEQVRTYLKMPVKNGELVKLPSFDPANYDLSEYKDDDIPF
jgi:hypothetical protein